jgi:hypothetical protein
MMHMGEIVEVGVTVLFVPKMAVSSEKRRKINKCLRCGISRGLPQPTGGKALLHAVRLPETARNCTKSRFPILAYP